MKIVEGAVAMVAWLLFLILIGEDCLRWYIIPLSSDFHQVLFAGMVCLSGASCLLAFRNLVRVRRLWQGMMLKLLSALPEMETKAEAGVYYTRLSLTSALCFYIVVAVWGIVYLSRGPFVKTGDLALSVFVAYHVTATVAHVRLERLKRSMKPRKAKV